MAPKRKRKKKQPARYKTRSARIRPKHSHLIRSVLSLVILLVLVLAAGVMARHLLDGKTPLQHGVSASNPPQINRINTPAETPLFPKINHINMSAEAPLFEVFPKIEGLPLVDLHKDTEQDRDQPLRQEKDILMASRVAPVPVPTKPTTKPTKSGLPKVAIIIDDIGYDPRVVDLFLSIDVPLTFSVLPFSPFQKKTARKIQAQQHELMLHLPMEPVEYPKVNPGPGALLSAMTSRQITNQLIQALDTIPGAVGVNNHMGSRLTTDTDHMYRILKILKRRGLYFIDSRTSYQSVSRELARSLKLPFAQRRIFLDNETEQEKITIQFKKLIRSARKNGEAVGIAHPHEETFRVLARELPRLNRQIHFVPASEIVHILG